MRLRWLPYLVAALWAALMGCQQSVTLTGFRGRNLGLGLPPGELKQSQTNLSVAGGAGVISNVGAHCCERQVQLPVFEADFTHALIDRGSVDVHVGAGGLEGGGLFQWTPGGWTLGLNVSAGLLGDFLQFSPTPPLIILGNLRFSARSPVGLFAQVSFNDETWSGGSSVQAGLGGTLLVGWEIPLGSLRLNPLVAANVMSGPLWPSWSAFAGASLTLVLEPKR
jgi:hypothetical protein